MPSVGRSIKGTRNRSTARRQTDTVGGTPALRTRTSPKIVEAWTRIRGVPGMRGTGASSRRRSPNTVRTRTSSPEAGSGREAGYVRPRPVRSEIGQLLAQLGRKPSRPPGSDRHPARCRRAGGTRGGRRARRSAGQGDRLRSLLHLHRSHRRCSSPSRAPLRIAVCRPRNGTGDGRGRRRSPA